MSGLLHTGLLVGSVTDFADLGIVDAAYSGTDGDAPLQREKM